MFSRRTETKPTALEEVIDQHISAIASMVEGSEEYTAAAQQLKTLMETRKIENEIDSPWRPSADAVIAATASLAGIIAILSFEKANVITTKAISFVPKIKT